MGYWNEISIYAEDIERRINNLDRVLGYCYGDEKDENTFSTDINEIFKTEAKIYWIRRYKKEGKKDPLSGQLTPIRLAKFIEYRLDFLESKVKDCCERAWELFDDEEDEQSYFFDYDLEPEEFHAEKSTIV